MTMAPLAMLVPLGAFALIALLPPFRRSGRPAALLSVAASIVAAWAAFDTVLGGVDELVRFPWMVLGGDVAGVIGWRVDATSSAMLVVVTVVAACVQVYSLGYLADEPAPALGRYYAWQSLFIFAMTTLVLAPDLLQLVVGWELVGLCSYLLIGHWWAKPSAARAAVKAVWVTRFADIGLLAGLVVLFVTTGTFSWEADAPWLVAALLFCGVMGKSAQVPLHVWLPDAMEGPTPVSALLHAATMVAAGVFLIVRAWPLFEAAPPVLDAMAWIGAITAITAATLALAQHDVKKVLAYSTCSQLGYMVAGLGSGERAGGWFHLVTHAGFKALLFLAAGAVIHAVGTNDMRQMGGLGKKAPVTAALFAAGCLALAGIPGMSGFFSKDLILDQLAEAGHGGPLVLLVASAGITGLYSGRMFGRVFLGSPRSEGHGHAPTLSMLGPMLLLLVPTVALGLYGQGWDSPLDVRFPFHWTAPGVTALTLATGGLVVGLWRSATLEGPAFAHAGGIDAAWTAAWRAGLLPFARVIGWVDRYVVDGVINLVGWAGLVASEGLRKTQTGQLRDYVYAAAVGAMVLGAMGALA
jgi:proton-translocating NADH-quinone oxidoreductase chain L